MLSQELLNKVDTLALVDKDGVVIFQEKFDNLEESKTQMVILQEVDEDEVAVLACGSDWGMMKISQTLVEKVSEHTGIPFPFLVSQLMGPILCREGENDEE